MPVVQQEVDAVLLGLDRVLVGSGHQLDVRDPELEAALHERLLLDVELAHDDRVAAADREARQTQLRSCSKRRRAC